MNNYRVPLMSRVWHDFVHADRRKEQDPSFHAPCAHARNIEPHFRLLSSLAVQKRVLLLSSEPNRHVGDYRTYGPATRFEQKARSERVQNMLATIGPRRPCAWMKSSSQIARSLLHVCFQYPISGRFGRQLINYQRTRGAPLYCNNIVFRRQLR